MVQPVQEQLPSTSLQLPPAPQALRSLQVAPPQQGEAHSHSPFALHAPLTHAAGAGTEQSAPPQQPSQAQAPVAQSQLPLPLHCRREPAAEGHAGGGASLGTSDNTCTPSLATMNSRLSPRGPCDTTTEAEPTLLTASSPSACAHFVAP